MIKFVGETFAVLIWGEFEVWNEIAEHYEGTAFPVHMAKEIDY